jgi:hypothetical protein
MSTTPTTSALDARARREVRNLARRLRRRLAGTDEADLAPTAAEVRGAAALLGDLYRAGRAHGIAPEEWWITVDLAELAIEAMVHIRRTATPPPPWDRPRGRDRNRDEDGDGHPAARPGPARGTGTVPTGHCPVPAPATGGTVPR